jgi:beta-glucuronidase
VLTQAVPRFARLLALAAVLAGSLLAPAAAGADVPTRHTLYQDGPDGRFLMGGKWLFRLDAADTGIKQRFMRQRDTDGWSAASVPNAWNLGDDSPESMAGSIGWYRKDFTLPEARASLNWIVRFESVNYRTRAWLNGRPIGTNKGAYVPFEFDPRGVKHHGTNRLVVRVDSRRLPTDFPPSGKSITTGIPTGGWWNYSGILREVYLRRVDGVDMRDVDVRPELPCGTCDASVLVRVRLDSPGGGSRRVHVTGTYGSRRLDLGTTTVPSGGIRDLQTRFTLRNPRLWSPSKPTLYPVRLRATIGGRTAAGYSLHSGVRSIKVVSGRLYLNGKPLVLRGVGYHEDTKQRGFAISDADRDWLFGEAKAVGANVMRTHYPPHPYLHELADRKGMLLWSEIPVFQVKTSYLKLLSVRVQAARLLQRNITANRNHPSVLLWSIGNELSSKPGTTQGYYIRRAVKLAHQLDPTRPVGIATASYPSAGCQTEYAPLDVIGFNEYFGWYPGPGGQIFDRTKLSGYLDSVRQCYPDKAIVITEFGAEANREGPVEEKGTWAFQRDFINYHMNVFATKPWLSGTIYWALNEFRVRPGWDGGNPRPNPPVHQKGLVTYDRSRKQSFYDIQQWYTTGKGPAPYTVPGN